MFAPHGMARAASIPGGTIGWAEQDRGAACDGECHVHTSGGLSLQALHGGPGCQLGHGCPA
eukprot:6058481-Lingulodinium_polyedra.AAC.1